MSAILIRCTHLARHRPISPWSVDRLPRTGATLLTTSSIATTCTCGANLSIGLRRDQLVGRCSRARSSHRRDRGIAASVPWRVSRSDRRRVGAIAHRCRARARADIFRTSRRIARPARAALDAPHNRSYCASAPSSTTALAREKRCRTPFRMSAFRTSTPLRQLSERRRRRLRHGTTST